MADGTLRDFDVSFGASAVVGADEVGRGCISGPLVCCATWWNPGTCTPEQIDLLDEVNDSKKLTARKRAALATRIKELAPGYKLLSFSAATIDRVGIQACNVEGLRDVALSCGAPSDALILIDGTFKVPMPEEREWKPVVKGDAHSAAIAAASIVAKDARDRMMQAMHVRWPQYGFDRHAGYPTSTHKAAVRDHGPCSQHRRSFKLG